MYMVHWSTSLSIFVCLSLPELSTKVNQLVEYQQHCRTNYSHNAVQTPLSSVFFLFVFGVKCYLIRMSIKIVFPVR